MLDHDTDAYCKISGAFLEGQPAGNLTRDYVLDNITAYWLLAGPRPYRERYARARDTPGNRIGVNGSAAVTVRV